jgi:hypothetical protein
LGSLWFIKEEEQNRRENRNNNVRHTARLTAERPVREWESRGGRERIWAVPCRVVLHHRRKRNPTRSFLTTPHTSFFTHQADGFSGWVGGSQVRDGVESTSRLPARHKRRSHNANLIRRSSACAANLLWQEEKKD